MDVFILDSMIFDKISEDRHFELDVLRLKNLRKIRLLITSIQEYQISQMPENKKEERENYLNFARDCCEIVPSLGFHCGISRVGVDMVGEEGVTVSLKESERTGEVEIPKNKIKDMQDETIALSAKFHDGFLVTEDITMTNRVAAKIPEVRVLSFHEFVHKLKLLVDEAS